MTLSELFPNPPFQPPARMDKLAEELITQMMVAKYGQFSLPIPTDAITCLIERDTVALDLFADLSDRGDDVEGVTDFVPGSKPTVRIAAHLSEAANENRLRTTISHEYGHVRLHDPLVQYLAQQDPLFTSRGPVNHSSFREGVGNRREGDLIEYQAWYFGGALLMPKSKVQGLVSAALEAEGVFSRPFQHSPLGERIQRGIAQVFGVSREAARIRLLKLGFLAEFEPPPTLF